MKIDRSIDDKLLKAVGALIIVPYVIVMTLMAVAVILGPLMIAATIAAIGCTAVALQWLKSMAVLLWLLFKWHISRWWWSKRNNL